MTTTPGAVDHEGAGSPRREQLLPSALLFFTAETSLHAGSGESTGVIDRPVQRRVSTGLPVLWGETVKGAVKAYLRGSPGAGWKDDDVFRVLGDDPAGARAGGGVQPRSGWLSLGEAELVLLPVPTLVNTYAWVTSTGCLGTLGRRAALSGLDLPALPRKPREGDALAAGARFGTKTALWDFVVDVEEDRATGEWAQWLADHVFPDLPAFEPFKDKLATDLVVVADSLLADLSRHAVDVTASIQLERDQKTVANGPWYTESLAPDTVLFTAPTVTDERKHEASPKGGGDLTAALQDKVVPFGGDGSTGKGLVWLHFASPLGNGGRGTVA